MDKVGENVCFLVELLQRIKEHRVEKYAKKATAIPRILDAVSALPRTTPSISHRHPARNSDSILELADYYYHLRWHSGASEYLPHERAIDGVARFL